MQYLRILRALSLCRWRNFKPPLLKSLQPRHGQCSNKVFRSSHMCNVEGFNLLQRHLAPSSLPQFLSLKHNSLEVSFSVTIFRILFSARANCRQSGGLDNALSTSGRNRGLRRLARRTCLGFWAWRFRVDQSPTTLDPLFMIYQKRRHSFNCSQEIGFMADRHKHDFSLCKYLG